MQAASTYLHALDGRLRIKVAEVKGSPVKALEIESQLQRCDGINHVTANPTTGNVLVLYDPCRLTQNQIIDTLRNLGCLQKSNKAQTWERDLMESIAISTTEFALQRLIGALL